MGTNRTRIILAWVVGGIAFGFVFVIMGCWAAGGGLGSSQIAAGHRSQPVLYIVDLAPIVLGATGLRIGGFHARLDAVKRSIEQQVRLRTAELADALAELEATQTELLSAQKLESIGALAAGIAHEINTPIQFIGDNARFLGDAFVDLMAVQRAASALAASAQNLTAVDGAAAEYRAAVEAADLEFLVEEIPTAVEQAVEGVSRVAEIVQALKTFAHPGTERKAPGNLNDTVTTTLAVARNEWKYVAEVDFDLDPDLPLVPMLGGELNQAVLNVVVNAAHAIADTAADGSMGRIGIRTRHTSTHARLEIEDTGGGIPEVIRDRVFDPFFTTKEVGKGSGQGLAIARSIVADKHGGTLSFVPTDAGTVFTIELPLAPSDEPAAA